MSAIYDILMMDAELFITWLVYVAQFLFFREVCMHDYKIIEVDIRLFTKQLENLKETVPFNIKYAT